MFAEATSESVPLARRKVPIDFLESTSRATKGFLTPSVELVDTSVPLSLAVFCRRYAVAEHASAIVSHYYTCFSRRQLLRTLALMVFRTRDRPALPFLLCAIATVIMRDLSV